MQLIFFYLKNYSAVLHKIPVWRKYSATHLVFVCFLLFVCWDLWLFLPVSIKCSASHQRNLATYVPMVTRCHKMVCKLKSHHQWPNLWVEKIPFMKPGNRWPSPNLGYTIQFLIVHYIYIYPIKHTIKMNPHLQSLTYNLNVHFNHDGFSTSGWFWLV